MNAPESTILLRAAPDRAVADEWAVALSADGLAPRVWPSGLGFAIGVPASQVSRAADVLRMYDQENRRAAGVPDESPWYEFNLEVAAAAAAMLAFFFLTGEGGPLNRWIDAGSGDADRILHGEPWRVVTALTLHVDFPHVLANALFLVLFLPPVLRRLGGGVGGLAFLFSGIAGNFLSALFYGTDHRAVGASTAVFGAVGILSALAVGQRARMIRHCRGGRGRVWLPLGAALALLAMLGAGRRSDLAAHLFGLLSGVAIGALLAVAFPRRAGAAAQAVCGALAAALLVAAWIAALGAGLLLLP